MPSSRRNLTLFALLSAAALGGIITYALCSRRPVQQPLVAAMPAAPEDRRPLAEIRCKPHLLFRNTALGPSYGHLMLVSLDAPSATRYATPLLSDRAYGTTNAGVCLQVSRGVFTTYRCVSFDKDFQVRHTFSLAGVPSRTRVSRDGRLAAFTVFVAGHSYSQAGFSTQTIIFDAGSAAIIGDLEDFAARKNDKPFKAVDFNYWGVTFANDCDQFYATLATGGKIFLVEGRVSRRAVTVLREGVECPSLSPDDSRLVFKSRTITGGRLIWRLHVLDLKAQTETVVNETHSVDDQSEWLDKDHVLYTLPRGVDGSGSSDVWVARADGTGTPRVFVPDATSPCVIRP